MPDPKQPRRATRTQVRQFLAAAGYEGTPPTWSPRTSTWSAPQADPGSRVIGWRCT
ncbi:hypothetical protein GCM10011584_05030 [Nocardioides phosphati]|uniref:Uncharacterized protein n=1 Tax=Nocardioides phosphati TaxID=1867775 RepID=A0ABQ2NAY1_9ACTN|nr:hypothetical protein [Nocardioides phosphati]GGO85323.1 hypothetical protein GCM10011584_05030 [Nocardioides phosphati]